MYKVYSQPQRQNAKLIIKRWMNINLENNQIQNLGELIRGELIKYPYNLMILMIKPHIITFLYSSYSFYWLQLI